YSKAAFMRFKKGLNIYGTDGSGEAFTSIPEEFDTYKVNYSSNNVKEPLQFKVKKAGNVFLLIHKDTSRELLRKGWTEVATASRMSLDGKREFTMLILCKYLDKMSMKSLFMGHGMEHTFS
ncbi:MAG: hypothetical protein K9M45_03000, partial [Kiritimatiellales bacterium]|nr:hypothetical protein [Kiritimatiellales bacterium]